MVPENSQNTMNSSRIGDVTSVPNSQTAKATALPKLSYNANSAMDSKSKGRVASFKTNITPRPPEITDNLPKREDKSV